MASQCSQFVCGVFAGREPGVPRAMCQGRCVKESRLIDQADLSRPHARLPPAMLFAARKDPPDIRATTTALIVANDPSRLLECAALLNSFELSQQ